MAIDPSIALQVKPLQIDSPINAFGQIAQLQQVQQQNALGRMKMDEYQRGVQEQSALRDALKAAGPGATYDQRISALEGTGLASGYSQADALRKSLAERDKSAAATAKDSATAASTAQKTAHDKVKFGLQGLAAANDPQTATQVALSGGLIPPEQAGQYLASIPKDPAGFQQWKQQTMMKGVELDKQFTLQQAAQNAAETARHNKSSEGLTARGQDITVRGQNMTDARSRESTAATLTKPFEVTGPDGTPLLVQQDRQGNITPVQGFGPKAGASKPLNDTQAKALGFGTRMQQADQLLNGLSAKGVNTPSMAQQAVGDVPFLGSAANMVSSPDQQSVEQAQRDFVNAVLRRESGAAISGSEFDNARKQYFPQRGDSAQVIAQKAANRKLATEGVIAEVPVGQRGTIGPKQGASPAKITSEADYNALPSGAEYIAPDGSHRKKK